MPVEAAIDTTVIRKANVRFDGSRESAKKLKKRLVLLEEIQDGKVLVLISQALVHEYAQQIRSPKNLYVNAFLEFLTKPSSGVLQNWEKRWSTAKQEKARKCRYPSEDDHVLRTAIRPHASNIFTEEQRMLNADKCIYKEFRVHIDEP